MMTMKAGDGFRVKFLSGNPYAAFSNFCNNVKFILLTSRQERQQKYRSFLKHGQNNREKKTVSAYPNYLLYFFKYVLVLKSHCFL